MGLLAFPLHVLYLRYWRSYEDEIYEFLSANELQYKNVRKPNLEDWQKGPFEKPHTLRFVGGKPHFLDVILAPMIDEYYTIIETKQGVDIWFELTAIAFKEPELRFRIASKKTK